MKTNLFSRRRRGMVTVEWILLAILFGLSLAAGALLVRNALVSEYGELVEAIEQVDLQECAACGPITPP